MERERDGKREMEREREMEIERERQRWRETERWRDLRDKRKEKRLSLERVEGDVRGVVKMRK